MNSERRPDFFVVGAPKSGTTSLYSYLKQHPQIFLPRIKELNFFCTDLHFNFPLLNEKQFMKYYDEWRNEKLAGEVSVWNLYSHDAAKNIHEFAPDAKIIIMLRQPVDMMYALHGNHLFNDNERIIDFEKALHAQEERKQGWQIPPTIKSPAEGLYYLDIASYTQQVKRYYDLFGKEKVKVIVFDDFAVDTEKVFKEVLIFLGADEDNKTEFRIFNARKTTRAKWLKSLTVNPPQWLKTIGKFLFPHQTKRRDFLMFWLWKINTKQSGRKELNPELKKNLTIQFKEEIENLQRLLNRDLTHWLL